MIRNISEFLIDAKLEGVVLQFDQSKRRKALSPQPRDGGDPPVLRDVRQLSTGRSLFAGSPTTLRRFPGGMKYAPLGCPDKCGDTSPASTHYVDCPKHKEWVENRRGAREFSKTNTEFRNWMQQRTQARKGQRCEPCDGRGYWKNQFKQRFTCTSCGGKGVHEAVNEITYAAGDVDTSGAFPLGGSPSSEYGPTAGTRSGAADKTSNSPIGACPNCGGGQLLKISGRVVECMNCQRQFQAPGQSMSAQQGADGVKAGTTMGYLQVPGGPLQTNEIRLHFLGENLFDLDVGNVTHQHTIQNANDVIRHRLGGTGYNVQHLIGDMVEWLFNAQPGEKYVYDLLSGHRVVFGKDKFAYKGQH